MDAVAADRREDEGGMMQAWIIVMTGQEDWSPWYWGRDARGTWGWLGGKDSAYQYPTREAAAELAHAFIASGHHKDSVIGLQEVIATEMKTEKTCA